MNTKSKLPHFLTGQLVLDNEVTRKVLGLVSSFKDVLDHNCHIVIVVPKLVGGGWEDGQPLPYKVEPYILHEHSVGKGEWEHDLDEIARCKAMQLWDGFADGELRLLPHLSFHGDTRWVGGVKREGIVVACSGFEEHFDRMVASMVADVCIALAKHEFENSPEKEKGFDWVGHEK